MIRTLPERSRKSLGSIKRDLEDLLASIVPSRPLSWATIRTRLCEVLELWPDLEEDVLSDLEAAHECGEVWDLDDRVILAEPTERGGQ